MLYDLIRVVDIPAIRAGKLHYFSDGEKLFEASLAEDLPHPRIENSDDALFAEYERLKDAMYNAPIFGYQFNKTVEQFLNLEAELAHRAFFTKDGAK